MRFDTPRFPTAIDPIAPDKPTPCPGCGATMQPQRLPRKPLGEVTIDLCIECQALWFDAFESLQLTPGATLALFETIRKSTPDARRELPSRLPCPRCTQPLVVTHDLQHTTRFTYYRCMHGHGRFTPFVQFLLEKDFIRPLAPPELARLKAAIRIVRCSSCGGPVDLETDVACPYCRAPIAILDPDAVDATVRALASAETHRTAVDVDALVDGMLDAHRRSAQQGQSALDTNTGDGPGVDLVRLGLAAVANLLAR
jgi:uncharacterized protein YbaR (Trm112 family)